MGFYCGKSHPNRFLNEIIQNEKFLNKQENFELKGQLYIIDIPNFKEKKF